MFHINKYGFIGTGGVFDYRIGNSAFLLYSNLGVILVDCGYTVYGSLDEKNLINSVDYLLLTHLHGDHVGSIHPLMLHLKNKCKRKLKLLYPCVEFRDEVVSYCKHFLIDVDSYLDFVDINDVCGLSFIDTSNQHVVGMHSYAFSFMDEKQVLFYSGDLGSVDIVKSFLVTHAQSEKRILIFHETSFLKGRAHVYYKDLEEVAESCDLYAFHCNHNNSPADCKLRFVAHFKEFLL